MASRQRVRLSQGCPVYVGKALRFGREVFIVDGISRHRPPRGFRLPWRISATKRGGGAHITSPLENFRGW